MLLLPYYTNYFILLQKYDKFYHKGMLAKLQQDEAYKLWVRKDKLVIPNHKNLINKILTEFHKSHIGGHAGINRTMARIQAQFY
jgi:hypothetical protein